MSELWFGKGVGTCVFWGSLLFVFALLAILLVRKREKERYIHKLEKNNRFMDTVFDSIQDGISILDRNMEIVKLNRVMYEWYPEVLDAGDRRCYKVYHGRDTPCDNCPTLRSFESGQMEVEEVSYVSRGREIGFLELFSFPIWENGSITGVVEYVRDISKRKKIEQEKEELISRLQKALEEIKTLQGILPVCSYCKRIRDDQGYWNQIESYISAHSDASFSHSICPECLKKHHPQLAGKLLPEDEEPSAGDRKGDEKE